MTPAELERRRTVVGASEVARLFGLPTFGGMTVADLAFEKKYGTERQWKGNESTKLGLKLEPLVIEMAEDKLGCKIVDRQKWVTLDHNGATLDGRMEGDGPVVEVKTSGILGPSQLDQWGDELTDTVPDAYLIQVQAQLLVTGAEMAYLAALIGGRGFALFEIHQSPLLQAEIVTRSREFIQSLSKDVAYPEPPQLETLKRIRRQPYKILPRSDEADALHESFSKFKEIAKNGDYQKELVNRKLLAFMGDAEAVEVEGGMYTYSEQTNHYPAKLASETTFRKLHFQKVK